MRGKSGNLLQRGIRYIQVDFTSTYLASYGLQITTERLQNKQHLQNEKDSHHNPRGENLYLWNGLKILIYI